MYEFQSLNISRIRRAFSRSLSSRRIVLARLFAMGYTSTGQLLLSVIWQSGMLTFESFQEMTLWSDLFCSLLQGIELGGGRRLGSARFRKRYSPRLFEVSTIAQLYLNGLERITMKQSIVLLFYAIPCAKLVNLTLVLLGAAAILRAYAIAQGKAFVEKREGDSARILATSVCALRADQ